MWLKSFLHRPWDRSRLAAILGALVLSVIAVILFFSVAAALFDVRSGFKGPGNFFVQAYGILAFIIPIYLFYAALLLADPRYRPDRIFCLTCSTIPFITLALGFSWYRRFDELARGFSFFAQTGKTGISFFVVMMTILEGCLIYLARFLLFFRPEGGSRPRAARGRPKSGGWKSPNTRFLPSPSGARNPRGRGQGAYKKNPGTVRRNSEKPERPEKMERPEKPSKPEKQILGCEDILPYNSQFIRGPAKSLFLYKPGQDQARRLFRFGDLSLPVPRWQKDAGLDGQYTVPVSPALVPGVVSTPGRSREAEEKAPGPETPPKVPARAASADVERALEEAKAAEARHDSPPPDSRNDPADDFDIDPLKSEFSEEDTAGVAEDTAGVAEDTAGGVEDSAGGVEDSAAEPEGETDAPENAGTRVFPPGAARPQGLDHTRKKVPAKGPGAEEKPAVTSRPKPLGPYQVPLEGILNQYPDGQYWIIDEATREAALVLKETLNEFHIEAEVTGIKKGPVITMF